MLPALASVVRAHPMLRVGITGEATNSAQFTHLRRINLHDHVFTLAVQCASEAALNYEVARIQAQQHNARWEDTATKSPWKVTVIRDEERDCADVVFAFHHSLLDGTSGRKFHEHFLAALETATDDGEYVLDFPEPPVLPAPQEETVPFTLGPLYIALTLWSEFAPTILKPARQAVWAGGSVSFALPYVTRIRSVDIPPGQTKTLLAACRQHKTTLTGLLHALAFAYFTSILPDDIPGFNAATPMGLHKHARDDIDTLRVLICTMNHAFSFASIASMRAALPSPNTLTSTIWATARQIREELATRSANLTHNNVMAMMRHVSDWTRFHTSRDGQPRSNSWECSNVGILAAKDTSVKVSRVLFSNGAMVTGAAVGMNVASAPDGHLTIGLSWQEGIVGDDVVEGLGRALEDMIAAFCENNVWASRCMKF